MSAPTVQTQDEAGERRQRIFQLNEEVAMMMAIGTKNVKVWISKNLRTRLGTKLFRGLALVSLLVAATTLYFSMSQGEAGSPSASGETTQAFQSPSSPGPGNLSEGSFHIREEQRAADRQNDLRDAASGSTSYYEEDENERAYDELRQSFIGIPYNGSSREDLIVDRASRPFGSLLPDTEYYRNPDWSEGRRAADSTQDLTKLFGEDVEAALGHEVLIARLNQYGADGSLSSSEMESLDHEIDMLLVAAANKASEAKEANHREIERLEQKISSMLAEASNDPSTNMSQLNREIEWLDYQISVLRLVAMQDQ